MNTNYKQRTMTSTDNHRSYFDWGSDMQIIRKGNGDIAMTEGELVRFFGVAWRKLNHRLQTIIKTSDLHPDERVAGEEEVIINRQLKGYARSIRFLSSSSCPFCWTAQKRICSGSISVRGCRNLHP